MVMVPSLLIAAIGGAITGWVSWKVDNPYIWILMGRAIQGIGAAGAMPVVIPCVGDLYKDENKLVQVWESLRHPIHLEKC